MNILETQKFLTYLWSIFPTARNLNSEDKKTMINSWFLALHEYSLKDVWMAADKTMLQQPHFVPSAYEIKANCEKHPDLSNFLPEEYFEIKAEYDSADITLIFAHTIEGECMMLKSMISNGEPYQSQYEAVHAQYERKIKMRQMEHEAYQKAMAEYDFHQFTKSKDDLISLGLITPSRSQIPQETSR